MSILYDIWCTTLSFFHDKWQDLLVTFIGTLLGFWAAIWLYRKQITDARNKERKEGLQRHLDHMHWFSGILKQVIRYSNKQAEQLELFVDRIRKEPSEHHQLAFVVSRSTERLVRANNESTFHAYSTVFASSPESKDDYLRLLAATDYITVGMARIKEVYEQYIKATYKRQLKLKALLEVSSNTLSAVLASMHNGGPNQSFLGSALHTNLGQLMNHYNDLIDYSRPAREFIEGYVQPLKTVVLAHEHQLDFGDLRTQLKDSTVIFTDIERDSIGFLGPFLPSNLREPAERLNVIHASIEEGIRHFEIGLK
jgi:hypothetical protein